eukprot:4182-Eustigmatos_ZCMA.PRE.1
MQAKRSPPTSIPQHSRSQPEGRASLLLHLTHVEGGTHCHKPPHACMTDHTVTARRGPISTSCPTSHAHRD